MKTGGSTIIFGGDTKITYTANAVGAKEGRGPLADTFDYVSNNDYFGQPTWEQAESAAQILCLELLHKKAGTTPQNTDILFSGDLVNQCTASCNPAQNAARGHIGLFGACSTMAEALLCAAAFTDAGFASRTVALTSSHFSTAERQFRYPLAYGCQRPQTSQWTVTGAGAAMLERGCGAGVYLTRAYVGKPLDMGITDANNMGAAMAPAAASTIEGFLTDTGERADSYDLILTGDLAHEGTQLLYRLLAERGIDISHNHNDCGLMIYDNVAQDVHSGASGCGCSAAVLTGKIMQDMQGGRYRRVLFAGTGALMNSVTVAQGLPIIGITHLVELEARK